MAAFLVLVVGIALFIFGGLLTQQDKKSSIGRNVTIVGYVLWVLAILMWLKH